MSGATRLHAFYNGGSRGGAKGAKDGAVGGSKLREEACVNDFGRFVHTGDVQWGGEEEERKAQWRVPRVHDTRECVFSLVTVTRDALARCIAGRCRMQRPYEATLRSERRAYVISACEEKEINNRDNKDIISEMARGKRSVATITLECNDRSHSECELSNLSHSRYRAYLTYIDASYIERSHRNGPV
ncbi:hypothetical protein ALC56_10610 [Trachymyrmex septentrionalis]|uniref:Uncharacterized protein n=1 Tax=Trachymyrmex septentrionalis TaxID=34720 RepID=A0A195F3H8_9HYME|nr:hypothetical protein ALC56_10610 [Trachymyrmex septentrionalis]